MQKNKVKSKNHSANSITKNTLLGVIGGFIIFIIATICFSAIVLKTTIDNKIFFIFVLISACLSSTIGSFITAITAKKTRFLNGMLSTLLITGAEFIILLCFNNSSLSLKIYFLIPINIFTGFIGSAIGSNIQKR